MNGRSVVKATGLGKPSGGRSSPDGGWTFHLGYGTLCLDFANTVSWRGSGRPAERLPAYAEVVRFGLQAGLLSADEARRLQRAALRSPGAAARALQAAIRLREALYRIFAGLAGGHPPRPADLQTLNTYLPEALNRLQVVPSAGRFGWGWTGDPLALDRLLWAVARDAAVFLTGGDLSRLRTCANPDCRWVFLDTTRSGTRRWCTMAVCGNRAKLHRFRTRRKQAAPERAAR
jgi:predicted RNA-binding Zn ribbon-like protein